MHVQHPLHTSRTDWQSSTDADLAKPVIAAGAPKSMQVCCALVQLQNPSADRLHEGPIVGDQDEGGVAAGQPRLHPLDGLQTGEAQASVLVCVVIATTMVLVVGVVALVLQYCHS